MSDSNPLKDNSSQKKKRGRPAKNQSPTNPPPPASGAESDSNPEPENEIEIESHSTIQEDDGWTAKLLRAGEKAGFLSGDETERVETRGRKKKTAAADEFGTLIVSLLVLILSFSKMPEEIKPNDAELKVFASHLSGLLTRHLPISSKFSQDSLDIIGLIAVTSGWYARVSPVIKSIQAQPQPEKRIESPRPVEQNQPRQNPVIDPLEKLSPSTAEFLDRVIKKASQNDATS